MKIDINLRLPKIGVDLHGTIDRSPELASAFMKMLMDLGYSVCIISGPPKEKIQKELLDLNIKEHVHYDAIHSIVDYIKEKKHPMWQDSNGDWWADDNIWWSAKNDICREFDIKTLIDNEPKYIPYMDPSMNFYLVGFKGQWIDVSLEDVKK